jgi:hypothetical protein
MSLVLLIAALVISLLVFTFLVRVVKSAVGAAIAIAIVVFAAQFFFGISPDRLMREVSGLWETLWQQVHRFW